MFNLDSRDYIYREFTATFRNKVDNFWRNVYDQCMHIKFSVIDQLPSDLATINNETLRIDYLMERISEEQWVSKLRKAYKKAHKNVELNHVLTMFKNVMNDIFLNLFYNIKNTDEMLVEKAQNEFILSTLKIREYTNEQIAKVNKRYESTSEAYFIPNDNIGVFLKLS
jgi:hypothetical protein